MFNEIAGSWTPPDGLGYSSLRPVRLTGQGKLLVGIMSMMVIFGVALGIFLGDRARRQAEERRLLQAEGQSAAAFVTETWIEDSKDRQRWIAYRFDYAGSTHTRRVVAPRRIWESLSAGSPIQVRFAPSQPSVSHPIDWENDDMPLWLAWVLPFGWAVPMLAVLIPIRRQTRLLAEGRPAPGRVTAFRKAGRDIKVQYEFRLPDGTVLNAKVNVSKTHAAVGDTICVLYEQDNPRRSAIYPLSFVRLDNSQVG